MVADSDHRSSYLFKFVSVLFGVLIDLGINSATDHSAAIGSVIGYTVVQIIVRLCSLFLVFMFMWRTFVFRYGLLGQLFKRFRLLFIVLPVSLAFTLAIRISRIIAVGSKTPVELWDESYYLPLFIIHNLFSILYYFFVLKAAFDLADPALYKAEQWIN